MVQRTGLGRRRCRNLKDAVLSTAQRTGRYGTMQPKKTAHSTAYTQHMAVRAGLTTSHNLEKLSPPHPTPQSTHQDAQKRTAKPSSNTASPQCVKDTYRDAVAQADLRGGRQVTLCAQQQRGGLAGRHRSPGFEKDLCHFGGVEEARGVQTVVPRRLHEHRTALESDKASRSS
jgi:hypothetical protein